MRVASLGLALAALLACGDQPASGPPPDVAVAAVSEEEIPATHTFAGRTEAFRTVELRAQVEGVLAQVNAPEAGDVTPGEVLFTIDPAPYEAELARAQAKLDRSERNLARVREELERARGRLEAGEMSEENFAREEARHRDLLSQVRTGGTALTRARGRLANTLITAPVAGRLLGSAPEVGSRVGPETGALITIVQLHPIYVRFRVDQLDTLRQPEPGRRGIRVSSMTLELELADGTLYPHVGQLAGTEGEEPTQLEVRGLFPNVDGLLLPGQDVNVTLVRRGRESEKLLVPQVGVQRDWRGSFVLIVGEANRVERRRITTGSLRGDRRVVEDGLLAGERVIVGGAEGVRPGMTVRPTVGDS